MGRWGGWGYRTELDGLLSLDTMKLKEFGYFKEEGVRGGQITWTRGVDENKSSVGIQVDTASVNQNVKLNYTVTDRHSGEKTDHNYHIQLATTPCNFGGKRYWFICPLIKRGITCNRRARKLYSLNGLFGCRVCHDLAYSSQNENHHYHLNVLFKPIEYERKAEELWEQIKTPYYAGKPTRKMRRYLELQNKAVGAAQAWIKLDEMLEK